MKDKWAKRDKKEGLKRAKGVCGKGEAGSKRRRDEREALGAGGGRKARGGAEGRVQRRKIERERRERTKTRE